MDRPWTLSTTHAHAGQEKSDPVRWRTKHRCTDRKPGYGPRLAAAIAACWSRPKSTILALAMAIWRCGPEATMRMGMGWWVAAGLAVAVEAMLWDSIGVAEIVGVAMRWVIVLFVASKVAARFRKPAAAEQKLP
jgi:hypothetical protein